MPRKRFLATIAMVIGLAVPLGIGIGVKAEDPRLARCGGDVRGNSVLTSFELSSAKLFWTRFPHAGMAPELEVDSPAYVVVFDGPATHLLMGPTRADGKAAIRPATRENVVCVVVDDVVNLYSEVDVTGFERQ